MRTAPRAAALRGVIKIVSSLPRTGSANAQTTTMVNGIKHGDRRGRRQGRRLHDPVRGLGRRLAAARQLGPRGRDRQRQQGGERPRRDGLHRHLQLRRRQDVDADPQQGGPGDGEPGQHRGGADQARHGRAARAGGLPSDRQGQLRPRGARPTTSRARSPPTGRARWASSASSCSTTARSTARASPTIFRRRAEERGLQVVGFEGIDAQVLELPLAGDQDQGAESRAGLLRRHHAEQRRSARQGHGRRAGSTSSSWCPTAASRTPSSTAPAPSNLNGRAYITFGGVPPEMLKGKGAEFYASYKKEYNAEPEAYAVYGYEAAKVALDGIATRRQEGSRRDPRGRRLDQGLRRRARQLVVRRERRHLADHHERQHRQGRQVRVREGAGQGQSAATRATVHQRRSRAERVRRR